MSASFPMSSMCCMSRKPLYRRLGSAVIVILTFVAAVSPRSAAQQGSGEHASVDGVGLIPADWNLGGKDHTESGRRAPGAEQQRQRRPAAADQRKCREAGGGGQPEFPTCHQGPGWKWIVGKTR